MHHNANYLFQLNVFIVWFVNNVQSNNSLTILLTEQRRVRCGQGTQSEVVWLSDWFRPRVGKLLDWWYHRGVAEQQQVNVVSEVSVFVSHLIGGKMYIWEMLKTCRFNINWKSSIASQSNQCLWSPSRVFSSLLNWLRKHGGNPAILLSTNLFKFVGPDSKVSWGK